MDFRPCIDIHDGKVKQIVGGSLSDDPGSAEENFVSEKNADFFAKFFLEEDVYGGHVILLNKSTDPEYEETRQQALLALNTFPGGLMVGGGIDPSNAKEYIFAGASHVIVTSYLFEDGQFSMDRLLRMEEAVGKEHLVIDLSCRKRVKNYYVVTNRWQDFTEQKVTKEFLEELSEHCAEFLIHGVDSEGKRQGVEEELLEILGDYEGNPITYAGGVKDFDDLDTIRELGKNHVDVTVGSALDLFGGNMNFEKVLQYCLEGDLAEV